MSGESHPEGQGRKPRPRQSARKRAARILHPLIPYVRQRLGRLSLALSGAIGVTAMRLLEPWPLKMIVDHLFFDLPLPHAVAGWLPEDANLLLLAMVGTIVVVALCAGGFYYLQRLMVSAVAIEITTSLRGDLYEHLHRLAPGHHDRQRLGETLTRLTADMRVMREGLVTVPIRLVEGLLLMVGMVAIMLVLDWQLALTAFLLLPLWAIVSGRLSRRLGPALARHRMREGAISDRAAESMGAVYVVQGFDGHAREQERFRIAEERSAEAAMRAARLAGVLQIASSALVGLGGAALVGLASWKVIHGQLTPGDLLIFVAYAALFLKPLREFAPLSVRLIRAMVAGERVVSLLETVPSIREAPDARRLSRVRGEISMQDVTVRAPDGRPILDRVNLVVRAGEHVVLTGPSGAGKSTLINLVLRFLDPDDGVVCIDGRDISEFTIKSLRSQITTVHQEPLLFSMSIADNIAYAREGATRAEVEAAAEAAGVAGLIRALTEGFDTQVGERGAALSGGERQAVSIARAMIRDTPIVILDEPTTALDPSAAQTMISSLMRLAHGKTILTVTHDPRLVRYGDRILSLEGGRIVDNGLESKAPRGSVVTAPD